MTIYVSGVAHVARDGNALHFNFYQNIVNANASRENVIVARLVMTEEAYRRSLQTTEFALATFGEPGQDTVMTMGAA